MFSCFVTRWCDGNAFHIIVRFDRNPPVTGGSSPGRFSDADLWYFFDISRNKLLNDLLSGWYSEMQWRSCEHLYIVVVVFLIKILQIFLSSRRRYETIYCKSRKICAGFVMCFSVAVMLLFSMDSYSPIFVRIVLQAHSLFLVAVIPRWRIWANASRESANPWYYSRNEITQQCAYQLGYVLRLPYPLCIVFV